MDLLASLGLGSDLPEQCTRLTSHPGVIKALDGGDDDLRLGFNRCLRCGVRLPSDAAAAADRSSTKKKLVGGNMGGATPCGACRRVSYCSPGCMRADARPTDVDDEVGWGHSPVVCSLLGLCDDDEDAEDELILRGRGGGVDVGGGGDGGGSASSSREGDGGRGRSRGGGGSGSGSGSSSRGRREAAVYRVRTERESYPATLFNVLSEGPDWFVEAITRRLRRDVDVRSPQRQAAQATTTGKQRRGKRDRSSAFGGGGRSDEKEDDGGWDHHRRREIVLHVVGASADSELWGWDGKRGGRRDEDDDDGVGNDDNVHVLDAYAEASANLASYLENLLQIRSVSIRCVFIGPDCPPANDISELPIPDSKSSTLTIETHRRNYGDAGKGSGDLPTPDAIVFFNPGFTCTDYEWSTALIAASASSSSCPTGGGGPTPFLIATNTEIEGYADVRCLLEGGHVDPRSLPDEVLEAMDHQRTGADESDNDDDYNSREAFLFRMNPYAGLRVRQSGTMGNDLYVKNRWIVCGLFRTTAAAGGLVLGGGGRGGGYIPSRRGPTEKRRGKKSAVDDNDGNDDDGEDKARKRRRNEGRRDAPNGKGSEQNAKRKNPALI
jgi:hypothetical protein